MGPLEALGSAEPFLGPSITTTVTLREAGWIRGISLRMTPRDPLPAGSAQRAATAFLLHEDNPFSQPPRFILVAGPGTGILRAALPQGTGLRVEAGDRYRIRVILTGAQDATDSYDFEFGVDFERLREGVAGLRSLEAHSVSWNASNDDGKTPPGRWASQPAGRRTISGSVELPAGRPIWGSFLLSPSLRSAHLRGLDGDVLLARANGEAAVIFSSAAFQGDAGLLEATYDSDRPALAYVFGAVLFETAPSARR
jgi:hypothetical protein